MKFIISIFFLLFSLLGGISKADFNILQAMEMDKKNNLKLLERSPGHFSLFLNREPDILYSSEYLNLFTFKTGGPEWRCLSEAIYFEGRGESLHGQFAIAEVVVNRMQHPRFPDTVCGVVKQGGVKKHRCQFSYMCDGRFEQIKETDAFNRAGRIAEIILNGAQKNLTDGSTFYHNENVSPAWSKELTFVEKIGRHRFYKYSTAQN